MTFLYLTLGRTLVAKQSLSYIGMTTATERMEHQKQVAEKLKIEHMRIISQSMNEPKFFTIEENKINYK